MLSSAFCPYNLAPSTTHFSRGTRHRCTAPFLCPSSSRSCVTDAPCSLKNCLLRNKLSEKLKCTAEPFEQRKFNFHPRGVGSQFCQFFMRFQVSDSATISGADKMEWQLNVASSTKSLRYSRGNVTRKRRSGKKRTLSRE